MRLAANRQPEMRNAPLAGTGEALNASSTAKETQMNHSITVPFNGNNLFVIEHQGEPFAAMRPIVEGMGMDWKAQFSKLKQRFSSTVVEITTVAADGKKRAMTCLPLRKLAGWLMTIHVNKVKPELREVIQKYQNECDDALWAYWTKGAAINPNYRKAQTRKALPNGLTIEQQEVVKAHHRTLVLAAPKDKQARLAIRLWSSVKTKFGVSYKEVPPDDFAEVISLMSREAVFGEYLPKETAELTVSISANDAHNLYCLLSIIEMVKPVQEEVYRVLSVLQSPLAGRMKSAYVEPYATAKVLHRVKLSCEPFYRKPDSYVLA